MRGRNWPTRVIRGALWRLRRRTRLRAFCNDSGLSSPAGFTLIRMARMTARSGHALVEDAMRAAGEPNGLAAPRFAHGDEFFGWLAGGQVVSFGSVTYRDRRVGPVRLAEAPGRVFLFNFHTLAEYRGRGLYPALLLAMRSVLGCEKGTEFVIEVSVDNRASARGIEKAGFRPVAQLAYLTIFDRWCCSAQHTALDTAGSSLLSNETHTAINRAVNRPAFLRGAQDTRQ